MKFLVINTDYPPYLDQLYARNPGLARRSYAEQWAARTESLFGVADFYSLNLRPLGHEAKDVYANNAYLQKAWAIEHGLKMPPTQHWQFRLRKGILPWVSRVQDYRWFYEILGAQIKQFKPDVLLNQAMDAIDLDFLREIKPQVRLLVGQHAATPLGEHCDWSVYDLFVSSFLPALEWFRQRNIPAELNRLAFEARILSRLSTQPRTVPVSFVGSFTSIHSSRTALLDQIAGKVPLQIWGPAPNHDRIGSRLAKCYRGPAWGLEMYRVLAQSQITLNHHGNVPPYANNMRLYEATGVGAFLLTDWKENLPEILQPDREVACYRNAEECVERIQYYLAHETEREAIARAGQQRTLREHTYARRMAELADVIHKYLKQ